MAIVTKETAKYVFHETQTILGGGDWNDLHQIGSIVPASGIYRCEGCGDEITSNKGDKFPPQNHHQHPTVFGPDVKWRLIVKTQTKA
ncbi:hypothetical protein [Pseudomonas extremaustralis]|uniref:Protein L n=1 Tax=Pseudomonas extremaustralis TaxID=359110 RepID=A0A5C5Q161_9PSED|nr:hypothetical protein [Pseudomonas extremaustralis]EZI23902.1 protein L [Pseudomonas extremaustralis 14-3 substr. 14-3b]TWR98028.1 protein L [Pseudomonas extremaustralis]SDE62321.1 hypothetical protein SAMN05216591_0410 [Pseudomonas extremaustralis]